MNWLCAAAASVSIVLPLAAAAQDGLRSALLLERGFESTSADGRDLFRVPADFYNRPPDADASRLFLPDPLPTFVWGPYWPVTSVRGFAGAQVQGFRFTGSRCSCIGSGERMLRSRRDGEVGDRSRDHRVAECHLPTDGAWQAEDFLCDSRLLCGRQATCVGVAAAWLRHIQDEGRYANACPFVSLAKRSVTGPSRYTPLSALIAYSKDPV